MLESTKATKIEIPKIVPINGTSRATFISYKNFPVRDNIFDRKTILFQLQKIRQPKTVQKIHTQIIIKTRPFSLLIDPLTLSSFRSVRFASL